MDCNVEIPTLSIFRQCRYVKKYSKTKNDPSGEISEKAMKFVENLIIIHRKTCRKFDGLVEK